MKPRSAGGGVCRPASSGSGGKGSTRDSKKRKSTAGNFGNGGAVSAVLHRRGGDPFLTPWWPCAEVNFHCKRTPVTQRLSGISWAPARGAGKGDMAFAEMTGQPRAHVAAGRRDRREGLAQSRPRSRNSRPASSARIWSMFSLSKVATSASVRGSCSTCCTTCSAESTVAWTRSS